MNGDVLIEPCQAKKFLDRFHSRQKEKLLGLLQTENWSQVWEFSLYMMIILSLLGRQIDGWMDMYMYR